MNIELLEEYVMLAKYLNFRETAERLNLSQPTLSRHISQLEADLGVPLFDRDKQSVRLTNVGQEFLPEARKILDSVAHAKQFLSGFRAGVTGQLNIGYKHAFGVRVWGLAMASFRERYPHITLNIHPFATFDEVHDSLVSGKIDVAMALNIEEFTSPSFRAITLAQTPLCAAMNIKNPLATRDTIRCEDLAKERLIFPHPKSFLSMARVMRNFLHSQGLNPKVVQDWNFLDEAILYINLHNYVCIVPKCYFPHSTNEFFGTRLIALENAQNLFHLLVLARKDNQNPAVDLFFSLCLEESHASQQQK